MTRYFFCLLGNIINFLITQRNKTNSLAKKKFCNSKVIFKWQIFAILQKKREKRIYCHKFPFFWGEIIGKKEEEEEN
jgi:hypothetical protein